MRTHLGEVMDYIRYTKNPCIIERHGKAVAVLMDIETYRRQNLTEQYRRWVMQATEEIKSHYQPQKIILFGSAATEPKDGSDIDLLIIKETGKRMADRVDEVLESLDPAIPAELHIYTPDEIKSRIEMGDFFIKQIMENGRVLYDRGA